MLRLSLSHHVGRRAGRMLALLAAAVLGAGARAAAQTLPASGHRYVVTVPFQVYKRPDFRSRVVRTIQPGDTVVAAGITTNGWTELRLPRSKHPIGFGQVTRHPAPTAASAYGPYSARSPVSTRDGGDAPDNRVPARSGWITAVIAACAASLWMLRRRFSLSNSTPAALPVYDAPQPWARPINPVTASPSKSAWPATRDVLAVQCKWTKEPYLGPNVVSQLHSDLQWYKQAEAGAFQGARGVIVTPAQMGSTAEQRARARRHLRTVCS